jgi:MFS superfamily sulfate permease-like transporter
VTVAALIAVLVFAGPILSDFPMAALGGLVVYAALKIVQFREFKWLWHFRRTEFWLGITTFFAVLVLDLLSGVAFAVALSAAVMLARVARPHAATLGLVAGLAGMHDTDEYRTTEIPGLVVFRYDSPLFFANSEDFRARALAAVAQRAAAGDEVREVLLNCEANVDADSTAAAAMDSLITALQQRGVVVALARVHVELADLLERAGILDLVGRDQIYPTLPTAVAAYHERFQ